MHDDDPADEGVTDDAPRDDVPESDGLDRDGLQGDDLSFEYAAPKPGPREALACFSGVVMFALGAAKVLFVLAQSNMQCTMGATVSARLQWEKRSQMIEQAVAQDAVQELADGIPSPTTRQELDK